MSDYYAFSSIDTAIDRTKSLLWPFNKSIWLRIALISLFLGGFSAFNPFQFTTGSEDMPFSVMNSQAFLNELPIILAIIGAIIVIAFIFAYISCVFQYLFVECLSKKEFAIRKYFRTNTGRGARLFGFEIGIGIIFAAIIGVALVLLFLGAVTSSPDSISNIGFIITLFLGILLLCIPFGIISLFTIDFVVPIMIKENCKLIEGWKKCWEVMKKDWSQTIIYLIMRVIIGIVVVILMLIAIMIAALILAIPFFIVGIVAIGISSGLFTPVFITLLVLFILCLIPITLIISVPFVTFERYYSLNVLGCMDDRYMLLE
jgi:hypothetical protein